MGYCNCLYPNRFLHLEQQIQLALSLHAPLYVVAIGYDIDIAPNGIIS